MRDIPGSVRGARPPGLNHEPTRVVNPGRSAPDDPTIGLVHVHVQSDRQTERAVCRTHGIQPVATTRPGSVKVGQHTEIAHDDILAADVPGTAQSQRCRRLDR